MRNATEGRKEEQELSELSEMPQAIYCCLAVPGKDRCAGPWHIEEVGAGKDGLRMLCGVVGGEGDFLSYRGEDVPDRLCKRCLRIQRVRER